MGSRHPRNAPYQAFKASDDYFAMAAGNDKLYADVCRIIERMDLLDRPEFKTTALRAKNQYALAEIVEQEFAKKTAAEWLDIFGAAGVPCGKINSYKEALSHPQVEHCGWVSDMNLPNGVVTKTFLSPVRFNHRTTPMRSNPPALNAHGDEIRAEMAKK